MIKAFVFDAYGTLFDLQSVWRSVDAAFPGRGVFITQIWRQKQLEYTWQRTAMDSFADFAILTRDALEFAIKTTSPDVDIKVVARLCERFNHLDLYPDAAEALSALWQRRLAILSNGSKAMLSALLHHADLQSTFEHVVSSDDVGRYKPHPDVYKAIATRMKLPPDQIALVSSNGFDLAGAKHFGLHTVRIERVSPVALRETISATTPITTETAFLALRSQMDLFAGEPDFICASLFDVVKIAK
jgi:2-haloacid dehalogenase